MSASINGTTGVTYPDGSTQATAATSGLVNKIINGRMEIDQRNAGASLTITVTNALTYTLDRWGAFGSQASKFSVQQNAGAVTLPSGFTNYLGVTSLAATSVGASENYILLQSIEGFNVADLGWGTANAKSVTLSFQVYSSLTGTFGGALRNSALNRSYPFTYTISSANTWTTVSLTIPGDTSGTWVTNNGVGITLLFGLGVGSTYSGTAGSWASADYRSATGATSVVGTNGATFYITGVDLRKGTVAPSTYNMDWRPYGLELALCQRYYFSTFFSDGATPSANVCGTTLSDNLVEALGSRTPVTMRANPTFTIWNANTGTTGTIRISGANIGVSGLSNVRPDGFSVISLSASGSRAGIGGYSFTASAEL